jgi:hypothetical protein
LCGKRRRARNDDGAVLEKVKGAEAGAKPAGGKKKAA